MKRGQLTSWTTWEKYLRKFSKKQFWKKNDKKNENCLKKEIKIEKPKPKSFGFFVAL